MMTHFQRDSKGMFRFILSILFILAISFTLSPLLSCRVSVQGEPYHQGPGPRPAYISGIEGPWLTNAANVSGRLEFHWTGNMWTGRIWFEAHNQWEELTNIIFDPRTGQIQFVRPRNYSVYGGTLSSNRISGAVSIGTESFPWEAWRP